MADVTPPVLENVSPPDGSTTAGPTANLEFDIVDVAEGGALPQQNVTGGDVWRTYALQAPELDGINTLFVMPEPVHAGSIFVFRDGILQNGGGYTITVPDPEAGEVDISPAPDVGAVWEVKYLQEWVLNAVDFGTITLTVNGDVAFAGGVWNPGWGGTLEPLERGYRFAVTTHPTWPDPPGVVLVEVFAADRLGNNATLSWSFSTVIIDTPELEDDGGYDLIIRSNWEPADHQVTVMVGATPYPCYGARAGHGLNARPVVDNTVLVAAVPPLPRGGPYDVVVTQGVNIFTFTGVLTIRARQWKSRTLSLRRSLPPWYKTGRRSLDLEDLLT